LFPVIFWIDESVVHDLIQISSNHENSIATNVPKKNLILIFKTQATLRTRNLLLHLALHNYKDPVLALDMNKEDEQ